MISTRTNVLHAMELTQERTQLWADRQVIGQHGNDGGVMIRIDDNNVHSLWLDLDGLQITKPALLTAIGERLTAIEADLMDLGVALEPAPMAASTPPSTPP